MMARFRGNGGVAAVSHQPARDASATDAGKRRNVAFEAGRRCFDTAPQL
jgi:hypothetical protein